MMRRWTCLIVPGILGLLLFACGSGPVSAPSPPSATMTAEDGPEIPIKPETGLPEDPLAAQLIGTTWRFGEIHATFVDARTLWLKGGSVAEIAEEGISANYTFKDGIIEFKVMGETRFGAWNGDILVLDGMTGERSEE